MPGQSSAWVVTMAERLSRRVTFARATMDSSRTGAGGAGGAAVCVGTFGERRTVPAGCQERAKPHDRSDQYPVASLAQLGCFTHQDDDMFKLKTRLGFVTLAGALLGCGRGYGSGAPVPPPPPPPPGRTVSAPDPIAFPPTTPTVPPGPPRAVTFGC